MQQFQEHGPAQLGSVVRDLLDEAGCVCPPIELEVDGEFVLQHHPLCDLSAVR
jgi:hypothetical protein